ncbi:MAG TPA: hypothetical protein VFW34_05735 [Candidatus Rubrimentiphilum sp.]|nr:hypothetical protein [Candidatus Rubrimentiphilum sp.]
MPAIRRLPLLLLAAVACFAAACGGTSTTLIQQVTTPATSIPIPTVTSQSNFTVVQTADLSASTNLPVAGGYSGTLQLGGAIQQYAQVTQSLQNTAPPSVAPLSMKPQDAGAQPMDVVPAQVLFYYGLLFDARTPAYVSPLPSPTDPPPAPVTLTVQVPASVFLQNVTYYLALYDPQRPSLGWQQKFAGPATVSGTTLTFTAAYTFNRYQQYWLAIYAASPQAPPPTPAPTISPLASPSPIPNSIVGIQAIMGPNFACSGTPCATGPIAPPTQGPATYTIQTGVNAPSISGNATQLTVFPLTSQPSDVLYFTPPLVVAPLTTNAVWDFYYYIDQPVWATPTPRPPTATPTPAPATMMALEFDFNMGMPNYAYNFSSQCLILDNDHGGPVWQIWGGGTQGWIDSGLPCNTANFTPNVWHHLTWTYQIHPDTLQTEYDTLTIDGTTVTVPAANALHPVQPRVESKTFLEVQFQQDMHQALDPSATPPPFKEWVDNVTLTYW